MPRRLEIEASCTQISVMLEFTLQPVIGITGARLDGATAKWNHKWGLRSAG